jgi:uncharacterized damage-inducible protein DinB
MAISDALLPEYDHEMANTRKALERVPDGRFDWKPHEKSMTMARLASHLAEIPTWAAATVDLDTLDLAPPGAPPYQPSVQKSREEVLAEFDKNRDAGRAAIAKAGDDHLLKPWSLLVGGKVIFTLPRIAVLRSFVMSHTIHHRAQLGVYLRLNDIPVPSIYGPSADESRM